MKRIAMFLSNAFDPDPRVHMIAKSLVDNRYTVDLYCWDRDGTYQKKEIIDGINVYRVFVPSKHGRGSSQSIFLSLFWLKVIKVILISKKKYDLYYCHDFDTLPIGYFLAKIFRKKLVYDSHESYVDMLVNVHHLILKFIYCWENLLLKNTNLVITVGELLKKQLEERGAKKVIVVGNWKNIADFSFNKEEIDYVKKELNLKNYKIIVSFISHLNPERKLPDLLEAISYDRETALIVGGKGPLADLVSSYARKYNNIFYLGFVKPHLIPVFTAISDIIFYGFDPRNKNARFSAPNKLFEALAAGKAIISGDFGEIGKIIREEKCGLLLKEYSPAEIRNAILKLKDNKNLLATLQRNAYIAAKNKYNWNNAQKILLNSLSVLF